MNKDIFKKMYWRSIFNMKSSLSAKLIAIKSLWVLIKIK
jgi:hypothetical protein